MSNSFKMNITWGLQCVMHFEVVPRAIKELVLDVVLLCFLYFKT